MKLTALTRRRPSRTPAIGVSVAAPAMFAVPVAAPEGPVARALRAARLRDFGPLPVLLVAGLRGGNGISGSAIRETAGVGATMDIQFTGDVRGVPPRGRPA